MKRRIIVDVEVNDDDHAQLIYVDIINKVRERTTVYQSTFDKEYNEM